MAKINTKKNNIMLTETTFSVREVAKISQFPGGEIKFFKWLRENKYLQKDNQPYQKYRNNDWMKYFDKKIQRTNTLMVVGVPRITIKGLAGLKKAVSNKFPPCPPFEGIS